MRVIIALFGIVLLNACSSTPGESQNNTSKFTWRSSSESLFISAPENDPLVITAKQLEMMPELSLITSKQYKVPDFYVTNKAISFRQWQQCVDAGACNQPKKVSRYYHPDAAVTRVTWQDITEGFLPWFNSQTGKNFRLLDAQEWRVAAQFADGSVKKQNSGLQIPARKRELTASCWTFENIEHLQSLPQCKRVVAVSFVEQDNFQSFKVLRRPYLASKPVDAGFRLAID